MFSPMIGVGGWLGAVSLDVIQGLEVLREAEEVDESAEERDESMHVAAGE